MKRCMECWWGSALNLYIAFGRCSTFTILILPICGLQKYSIFWYLQFLSLEFPVHWFFISLVRFIPKYLILRLLWMGLLLDFFLCVFVIYKHEGSNFVCMCVSVCMYVNFASWYFTECVYQLRCRNFLIYIREKSVYSKNGVGQSINE